MVKDAKNYEGCLDFYIKNAQDSLKELSDYLDDTNEFDDEDDDYDNIYKRKSFLESFILLKKLYIDACCVCSPAEFVSRQQKLLHALTDFVIMNYENKS